jgi:peptidyl-tRNA hydrolase, PTH1 family
VKLIVGLGNPGAQYELTRHNIGFIILDLFAEFFHIKFKAGKGDWLEGKGKIEDEEVYLLKPTTYMNNSGVAVIEFIEKHNIDKKDVLIVTDDFQIPLGTIRVRPNGSDGGHNGLSSIIYHLNSDEFARMRIGIGKDDILRKDEFIDFVLNNFNQDEIQILKEMIPKYIDTIKSFITEGITKTMNNYNKSYIS